MTHQVTDKSEDTFDILDIPKVENPIWSEYPGICDSTRRLFEELRDRIEAQGRKFSLRRFKEAWGFGTIVGRTGQTIVFLEYETADRPELFYIFHDEVRDVSVPLMFKTDYLDGLDCIPIPPLITGLIFTLQAKDDGYYLECKLPPAWGKITYGKDARQFCDRYPSLTPEARRKRKQGGGKSDDGAFTSFDLKPSTSEPRP
jgi:hypothetical protein